MSLKSGSRVIVIGGSAGALQGLVRIVGDLPPAFPAAVLVVIHVHPQSDSHLAKMLARASALPVADAEPGEPVRPGRIYVAPPDHHLLVEDERVLLLRGPRENRARPAIDPLFRSAARCYGERVIGVILSGRLSDGVAGLLAIKHWGGVAIVQDPAEARAAAMPEAALRYVSVDYTLPAEEIASTLVRLCKEREIRGEEYD